MAYVIPKSQHADYRAMIQRANRRIMSNIKLIQEEGIRDNALRTHLAGDFYSKRKWQTGSAPLSSTTKFESEEAFKKFVDYVKRWGEDTGKKGGHRADPKQLVAGYRTAIYKAINGMLVNNDISLEEWGGDLPPDLKEGIENLSLEQMRHFFQRVNKETGLVEVYDSDQVESEQVQDYMGYFRGIVGEVRKFYPKKEKKTTKKGKRRKSRKKKKGRTRKKG